MPVLRPLSPRELAVKGSFRGSFDGAAQARVAADRDRRPFCQNCGAAWQPNAPIGPSRLLLHTVLQLPILFPAIPAVGLLPGVAVHSCMGLTLMPAHVAS